MSLYMQLQRVRSRKLTEQLKESGTDGHHHPPPGSHVSVARTLLDGAIDAYLKWKLCNDLVKFMDDNIRLLQEQGSQMTEQQKKELREMTVQALDLYSEHC